MPLSKKRSVTYLLLIAAALLVAYSLRFVFHPMTEDSLLAISMMTLRWAIQVPLTVAWCASIRRRILNTSIRKMLLTVGGLLLLWQVARIIKFDYVIVTEPIGRYCWYSYYIAMILVPLIGVFVVDHIGKPEGYRSPVWMRYLFIPALFLLGVVFTNDLHQLVFTFPNGFEAYNSDYGYGFMYIPVMAWFFVLALFFVIGLMVKSRVPGSKRFQAMPLLIAVFGIGFWTAYSLGFIECDLTAVDSLIIIMLLEGAIQSGLIPSNMNYRELFAKSTIAAQIVDGAQQVHYASANAAPLDKALMAQAQQQPVDLGDTILHSQAIHGGHIFWQDDVKAINDLADSLRDANDTLGRGGDEDEVLLHIAGHPVRSGHLVPAVALAGDAHPCPGGIRTQLSGAGGHSLTEVGGAALDRAEAHCIRRCCGDRKDHHQHDRQRQQQLPAPLHPEFLLTYNNPY